MIDFPNGASPAAILAVAFVAFCIARGLFRVAFRVLFAFAVIGAGAVITGMAPPPAGLDPQSLTTELQAVLHQAVAIATGMLHGSMPVN